MRFNAKEAPSETRVSFPRFELKKDETARIAIPFLDNWEVTIRHYVQGLGYVHCLALDHVKEFSELALIEEEGGRPDLCVLCAESQKKDSIVSPVTRRFALFILRYKTDMKGKVDPHVPLAYWLEIWVIDSYKYRQLKVFMEEWGDLRRHDIGVTCKEARFMQVDMDVKKEALWLTRAQEVVNYLQAEIKKYDLMECLGRKLTEAQILKKLAFLKERQPAATITAEPEPSEESILNALNQFSLSSDEMKVKEKPEEEVSIEKTKDILTQFVEPEEVESEVDFLKSLLK